ncbi:hypothetical protein AACH06_05530 [Ideonella sp. DXS29W]|uniref:Uncharacterized protein n=1 Tax=Ideonella lacteola TaxID=2984193 RepID=A0ABU9BJY8_9BURK
MPMYDDLYIRDLLGESGQYPTQSATLMFSPDIICWGVDPLPDARRVLSEGYGQTWYRNPVRGQKNYVYVRAKNLFPGSRKGEVRLYYAPGGTVVDIQAWRENRIGTAIAGQDFVKLDAQRGEVVVGDTAFVWTPPETQALAHYCFIAQLSTESHPNPLPERFADYNAYLKWVADNPALGWRNIDVVSTQSPPAYQGDFVMTNLETRQREFLFILEGEKLPKDTLMQMFCAATGPQPPVDSSGEATGRDRSQITATSWLPGSFSAYFTATITLPPGQRWSPSMSVRIEQFAITQSQDDGPMHSLSRPIREILAPETRFAGPRDGHATRLGSFTVKFDEPS